jgi:hypothetical protein
MNFPKQNPQGMNQNHVNSAMLIQQNSQGAGQLPQPAQPQLNN